MSARTHTAYGVADTVESLQAKIAALELAFERHELTVEFADRKVTYASTREIEARIDYFKRKLALLLDTARSRPRQFFAVTGRGLDS